MPVNQQLDSGELRDLAIPYDTTSPELSSNVRYVSGSNVVVSGLGKLVKRPGTTQLGSFAANVFPGKVDHYIIYETIDNPPKCWLVASVFNVGTGFYEAWAVRLDGSGTPVSLGTLRNLNQSTFPHEFAVSRGLCYIKAFPGPTGDKLGSVIFNGSINTTSFWGLLGPTVAAHVQATAGWSNSTFTVTVNFGWYYVYTWKEPSGQESTRSPLETNPANASSNTGPISGTTHTCPQIIVQGNADQVNVTTIRIYRSTDGGGSFYFLDEITNTGAGNITYNDKNFNDGNATPSQPAPDTALDTSQIAPSLTSNTPPPTVAFSNTAFTTLNGSISVAATSATFNTSFNGATLATTAPAVPFTAQLDNEYVTVSALNTSTGVATIARGINGSTPLAHANAAIAKITPIVGIDPVQRCSPMAIYSGRIWYSIGNVLFFSGQEEIGQGIPEECWPAGLFGNFYRFNLPLVNNYATSEALYCLCTEECYWLRGNTKDTFQLIKLFADVGARRGHPRAVAAADKSIVWLTQDLRLCMARGYNRQFLSDLVSKDIRTAVITNGSAIHLARHAELEKDWLIMAAVNSSLPVCKQWIYNFNEGQTQQAPGIWSPPWNQPVTAMASGQPFDTSDLSRHLTWASSGGAALNQFTQTDITGVTVTDFVPGTGATNYGWSVTVSLVRNATGDHVNQLREPGMVSVLYAIKLDKSPVNTPDTPPTLGYSLDDLTYANGTTGGQGGINVLPEIPPRREQSTGYSTFWYMINQKCERVAATFSRTAANERFEAQVIAFVWNPNFGA